MPEDLENTGLSGIPFADFCALVSTSFGFRTIKKYGERIQPTPTGEILPDMKDLPFYEVVVERRDDEAYLVTGNMKHFPVRPFIVTAKEFLDILSAK